MVDIDVEGRLRRAAITYERVAPRIPDLERRILARIAVTPRGEHDRPSRRFVGRSWQVQLLATAALLAFAVAVAFLLREAQLHKPQPVTSPRSGEPLLVTSLAQGGAPMSFLSAQEGWVVTRNALLLTRDGGKTWRNRSPLGTSGTCCTAYFLDGSRGWAGAGWQSAPGFAYYRTVDGGKTWKQLGAASGPLPPSFSEYVPALDFVDDQYGWYIYQDSTSNGTPFGGLARTTDGGATWSPEQILPAVVDEWNYGTLSPRAWIRFIDRSTGWFIAQDPARYGGQQLYGTHDGGVSWHLQAFPVPAEDSSADNRIGLPARVNGVNGEMVLPVTLAGGRVLLDFSDDGGFTWKMELARAPIFSRGAAIQGQGRMAPTFAGNGVIALVLGDQIELKADGSWTRIRPAGVDGAIVDIEFANAKVGWLLQSTPSCQIAGCQFVLLKTTDGGSTWSPVSS